jgi:predicted aspartyl protease
MRFPYAPYRVVPTAAAPDRDVLYRPVIPVRFISPQANVAVRALLDTGADESYITEEIALLLGARRVSDDIATILSASGEMPVWYTSLTLEVTDFQESYKLPITVGVVSEEWLEMILGHVGFFEHFDAMFSDPDRIITLTRRT